MSLNKCQILFLIYYTNLYCTRPQTHSNSNSLGVGNCVDCLVPGGTVGAGNRNTQYQRGLVPILRARRAVWQDGVRILCGKHARFNIECMNISSVSCPILQLACTHPPPKWNAGLVECWNIKLYIKLLWKICLFNLSTCNITIVCQCCPQGGGRIVFFYMPEGGEYAV